MTGSIPGIGNKLAFDAQYSPENEESLKQSDKNDKSRDGNPFY